MALRRQNQVATAKEVDTFTIEPREGESIVIKGIYVDMDMKNYEAFKDSSFVKLYISKASVGILPVNFAGNRYLAIDRIGAYNDFWRWIKALGINMNYPVAEGEEFNIVGYNILDGSKETMHWVKVLYDVYDAGDIKGTEENGAFSDVLTYFNYMTIEDALGVGEVGRFNLSYLPAEYSEFPISPVPSKFKIRLIGMAGKTAYTYTDASNYVYSEYVRLYYRRTVLFDDDRNGLIFCGADGLNIPVMPANEIKPLGGTAKYLYTFENGLEFMEGDELNIEVLTNGMGTATISGKTIPLITLQRIEPIR